ncbi:MAG: cation diffusion facilitator family transporter [Bacilli bacterium]|nr:cation diffusion facilitator family transporter [Bacilli bacterium]
MKLETAIIIYSMINNLIISSLKIVGGLLLGLSSLMADGLHTFVDFITDIISIIGIKFSKKKPTKHHPFGYGKIEYLTNLYIGVILFLLGTFIIVHGLISKTVIPPISLLGVLLVALCLKLAAILTMHIVGEKIHSQLLITSTEESKTDLYSSIGVLFITIILQFANKYEFLTYVNVIGTVLIGLYVIKTAIEIMAHNSMSLIGETIEDEETINKINKYLKEFKDIEDTRIRLIKYGSYYKLELGLDVIDNMSLRRITNLENKVRKGIIRHRSLKVKYVSIYVTNKFEK